MKEKINHIQFPKVSIIVPIYNVEKYLKECIDSILAQTFQEIEIVLVDDGSLDASGQICDDYAKLDKRIRVIHQENQGLSGARNSGVEMASAQWITLVDGDDIIHPQMIEMLYKDITENDIGMTFCNFIEAEQLPMGFDKKLSEQYRVVEIDEKQMQEYYHTSSVYWRATAKLMRKDIYLDNMLERGRIFEDNAVACKWLFYAKKVIEINHGLYFYRQREASIMHQSFSKKKIDYLWALEEQIKFFDSVHYHNMLENMVKEYIMAGLYLRNCVDKELHDETLMEQIKKDIVRVKRKYKKKVSLDEKIKNDINREIYPLKYSIIKKARRVVNRLKKLK